MKVAFIACEYNPFHKGHQYHIKKTKENSVDAVVCVMSGNFVQRGDIAIADKYIRAKTALLNGADLVIELPLKYATADASHFAEGFIRTVKATGIQGSVSFGAENNLDDLLACADLLFSEQAENFAALKLKEGINYPTAKSMFIKQYLKNADDILSDANNILALEYINNAKYFLDEPEFICIKRNGSSHDSLTPENDFASAGYLRKKIYADLLYAQAANVLNNCKLYIPGSAYEVYTKAYYNREFPADPDKFNTAVFSRLLTFDSEYFSHINNVSAGLENRITDSIRNCNSVHELYASVKTKRYTHSRIRQIMLQAALGITREDISAGVSYIRILGFNSVGRQLLSKMKTLSDKPLITNLSDVGKYGKSALRDAELDYNSGKLFNLCLPVPNKGNTEFSSHPFIII